MFPYDFLSLFQFSDLAENPVPPGTQGVDLIDACVHLRRVGACVKAAISLADGIGEPVKLFFAAFQALSAAALFPVVAVDVHKNTLPVWNNMILTKAGQNKTAAKTS